MPRVIEEMVKARMISHENAIKLGKHALKSRSEADSLLIPSGNELEEGEKAGIVEVRERDTHQRRATHSHHQCIFGKCLFLG